jgi:hypothetical protein
VFGFGAQTGTNSNHAGVGRARVHHTGDRAAASRPSHLNNIKADVIVIAIPPFCRGSDDTL